MTAARRTRRRRSSHPELSLIAAIFFFSLALISAAIAASVFGAYPVGVLEETQRQALDIALAGAAVGALANGYLGCLFAAEALK